MAIYGNKRGKGEIRINRAAMELIGLKAGEQVVLVCDKKRKLFGVRKAQDDDYSYLLRGKCTGQAALVTAGLFFDHYGIRATGSFDAERVDARTVAANYRDRG